MHDFFSLNNLPDIFHHNRGLVDDADSHILDYQYIHSNYDSDWDNTTDTGAIHDHHNIGIPDREHGIPETGSTEITFGSTVLPGGTVICGEPLIEYEHWHHQHEQYSCTVVSQMGIYESITGRYIPESEWCEMAEQHGWYDPQIGTYPNNIGKVLNAVGIHTETHYDATLQDIEAALERGDKVMVGLNANEIWHPRVNSETGEPAQLPIVGHTVWVTGISVFPDGTAKVILNDSGVPDGAMNSVDAGDFINAWHDFGGLMVVAHA